MQFRSGLLVAVLAASCGLGGLVAVPHAAGGRQAELLQCLWAIPTLAGTHGDDVLVGTHGDDVIVGLGGNDVIEGGDGSDLICGGAGNDRITPGIGFFESDGVSGDGGDDLIVAGPTHTTVVYVDAPAPVSVDLEAGVATGWGTDTLVGVGSVVGSPYDDTIRGSAAPNCLEGLDGEDVLVGLGDDDCLYGGAGSDALDGGSGTDITGFEHVRNRMTVNLATGVSRGEGFDRLAAIERVTGTSFPDVLTGDATANELVGGGGADRIAGGAGTDRLDGGSGRDRVDGGVGRDQCLHAEQRLRCP